MKGAPTIDFSARQATRSHTVSRAGKSDRMTHTCNSRLIRICARRVRANKPDADNPLPSTNGGTGTTSMTFPDTTATHHTQRGRSPAPCGVHADVRTGGPLEESRDSTPQECCARGKSDPVTKPEDRVGADGLSHPDCRTRRPELQLGEAGCMVCKCNRETADLPGGDEASQSINSPSPTINPTPSISIIPVHAAY
jgi:hypothetical protein